MLLVDHHQPQVLETHLALQQPLRGDDDVDRAGRDAGQHSFGFLVAAEARQAFDAHRPVGKAIGRTWCSAAARAGWSAPAPRLVCRPAPRRRRRAARPRFCRSRRRRRSRDPWACRTSSRRSPVRSRPPGRQFPRREIPLRRRGIQPRRPACCVPCRAARREYRSSSSAATSRMRCAALRRAFCH